MATIIEVKEDKIQHLSEYAEKVLKYGGKLMQCLEELESGSKYNEYYGQDRKHYDKDRYEKNRWDDDRQYNNRYY